MDSSLEPAPHKCDFKEYATEKYQIGELGALLVAKSRCHECGEKNVLVGIGHFGAKKS